MEVKHFYFTLGPVQGFVAQARRTRDFWAGSFLLSWLSAVAMKAVIAQKGEIGFPAADKDFLNWLEGKCPKGCNDNCQCEKPEQGSVPNRFKASVKTDFEPELIEKAVQHAWKALADKIYQGDLSNAGGVTKEIWNRQIDAFWDMNWVLSDKENPAALDQRKNHRSYRATEEGGVKCMMMEGWQELSGEQRPSEKQLNKFWQGVINQGHKGIKTDLREKEYLCAIAFVKRRFARYFHQIEQEMDNGWSLKGWKVKAGRPSASYMAAVHWLKEVLIASTDDAVKKQLWRFHDLACELTQDTDSEGKYTEWENKIKCIEDLSVNKKWHALDGNVFFKTELENKNLFTDQDKANDVIIALGGLLKLINKNKEIKLSPPTPFYAVLMMDGDSLGVQMSETSKQQTITDGLETFTKTVGSTVTDHNGFLIYAGGDDVLAVLPLENALDCALVVRQKYKQIFDDLNKNKQHKVSATISAAIEYAHIKMPLTRVLKDAHGLLDDIAKEQYGRDAIAVRVWKPGGKALEWGMPWEKCDIEKRQEDPKDTNDHLKIDNLAYRFKKDDDAYGQLSNTFLYKIRERFELLNSSDETGKPTLDPKTDDDVDLMAAEYYSSGLCESYSGNKMEHARAVVRPLLKQCRPIYRQLDEQGGAQFTPQENLSADAALLVRFLAQKGVSV